MNFIEDVVERFPAARPALIEVAADGSRRMHHFGELFARSGGPLRRLRRPRGAAAATWS